MESEGQGFLLERHDQIAYIIFNRPEKLNAFRQKDYELFEEMVNEIEVDDSVRAVIVTGKGRGFTAGDDLYEMPPHLYPYLFTENPAEQDPIEYLLWWSQYLPYHIIVKTIQTIMDSGKVYIAAVNGVCYQTELLYPLDFVIAADVAPFAQGDVSRMGIVPAAGSTQTLPRVLGRRRAIELMLTGDEISAQEAYRIGLVNKVVPLDKLMEEAEALARKVSRYPQHAIKLTKMAITKAQDLPLKQGLEIEGYYSRISHTRAHYTNFSKTFLAERKAAKEKKDKNKS